MKYTIVCLALLLVQACAAESRFPEVPSEMPPHGDEIHSVVRLHSSEGRCSAVLVSPTEAITAAHCVAPFAACLGSACLDHAPDWIELENAEGDVVQVATVQAHGVYDVAYLELAEPLEGPCAELAAPGEINGSRTYMAGLGCSGELEARPLGYAYTDSSDRHVLAGHSCGGDSGGGVFAEGHLVGITSGKGSERDPNEPIVWAADVRPF